MIKSFTIYNNVDPPLYIDIRRPDVTGFLISNVSGLGPGKVKINTTEVSTNDGSIYNSSHMGERNIVFDLKFEETSSGESIEDIRQKTYKYFPIKKNIKLIIETDKREVIIEGYVENNEPNIFSSREGTQISIICPDPFFYSVSEYSLKTTVFYGIDKLFEFPFENNSLTTKFIEFGSIQNKTENYIRYDGDSEVGIVIYIHALGDVTDITIYNTKTRQVFKLKTSKLPSGLGDKLIAGDDIVINTNKGMKSVYLIRNGIYYNILNAMDKQSSWFRLMKGDNIFAFEALSGTEFLQFRIENDIVYEGV